jgi:enoyl-CoA hydratase
MAKPVVCQIHRTCVGGALEVALGCDLRIASSDAQLGLPEVKFGIIPDVGGSTRLPAVVGLGRAKELIMTARMIDAAEAERTGLVSRVFPADKVMDEAMAIANAIAEMPVTVAMQIKDSVNRAFETTLTEGVRYERRYFHAGFGTPAQKEGMSAFLEKRKPNFEGM